MSNDNSDLLDFVDVEDGHPQSWASFSAAWKASIDGFRSYESPSDPFRGVDESDQEYRDRMMTEMSFNPSKVKMSIGGVEIENGIADTEINTEINTDWISVDYGPYDSQPTVDTDRYPHQCPICDKPAYIGGDNSVDCSSCDGKF